MKMTKDNVDAICGYLIAIFVVGFIITILTGAYAGIDSNIVGLMLKISVTIFSIGAISSIVSNFFNLK